MHIWLTSLKPPPCPRGCSVPQFLGRFALQIDPVNPRKFVKTTTPVTNADLDPWLIMPCGQTINGAVTQCSVPKDTIMVLPGSYTRIAFNAPAEAGLYVWHCNLLEHEDNEMMVPFCFGSPTYPDPRRPGQLMCPGQKCKISPVAPNARTTNCPSIQCIVLQ